MLKCAHTGLTLDESMGYCPNCLRMDCAVEVAEWRSGATLTTDCTCGSDDEGECYGDCHADALDMLNELFKAWYRVSRVRNSSRLHIKGQNMTWQRLNGYIDLHIAEDVDTTWQTLLNAVRPQTGEFRLEFEFKGDDTITIVRYSHDEPTGASMVVRVS